MDAVSIGDVLHPAVPERVWLALADGGRPLDEPPVVEAVGGEVWFDAGEALPGLWPLTVRADPGVHEVVLHVQVGAERRDLHLPVGWPSRPRLVLPGRTEAVATQREVVIPLRGEDLPAPEDVRVFTGEGRVSRVERVDDALLIHVELDETPAPRVFSVGVMDTRLPLSRPVWGEVRVRARPRIPLEVEPRATVRLTVGEREYGPFVADAEGRVTARIDQYPGETTVTVHLADDLGNTTDSILPLASADRPALLAVAGSRRAPSQPPRVVWLRALHPAGRGWRGDPPACRSPSVGALPVVEVAPSLYAIPIEGRVRGHPAGIRLECVLHDAVATLRLGPKPGFPAKVLLHVWPAELSTDLPLAEVRVALEDARGRRLPPESLVVGADWGVIKRTAIEDDVLTAEYDGAPAVARGVDRIIASYRPAVARGRPFSLEASWETVPQEGAVRVVVQVRDRDDRPVRDVALRVGLGTGSVEGRTDDRGRAVLQVPLPVDGHTAMRFVATAGPVRLRTLALRGVDRSFRVDTRGDVERLEATRTLTLSPGRVRAISVSFEPPILRMGRGSVAYVVVALEDRAGRPVIDEAVDLHVSEGRIGPLIPRSDGTLVAEYHPAPGERAREVAVTARTDTVESTARLALEPPLGRVLVGPSLGWTSNLGLVNAPRVGFVVDVRTGWLGETVLLRVAGSGYGVRGRASTGIGDDAALTGSVLPLQAMVLLRRDRGGLGFWGGLGGSVALHPLEARFGSQVVAQGTRVLSGGAMVGGVGYRLGVADLVAEIEWAFLPGPGGDLAFTGNLGGLTASTGFRMVY